MLPLSVLRASNLEAPHKHHGVYITCETHPEGEKIVSSSVSFRARGKVVLIRVFASSVFMCKIFNGSSRIFYMPMP